MTIVVNSILFRLILISAYVLLLQSIFSYNQNVIFFNHKNNNWFGVVNWFLSLIMHVNLTKVLPTSRGESCNDVAKESHHL